MLYRPQLDIVIDLILGVVFLGLVILVWPRMRVSYKIYTLMIVLASFSYYNGSINPTMALPRHLFLAFPVFIYLPSILNGSRLKPGFIGASTFAMLFCLSLYVFQGWIP